MKCSFTAMEKVRRHEIRYLPRVFCFNRGREKPKYASFSADFRRNGVGWVILAIVSTESEGGCWTS